jgi:hypothetical protein
VSESTRACHPSIRSAPGVAHGVAQLPLQPAHRGDRLVPLLGGVEAGGQVPDARAHLDRVGQLLDVVGRARVEHGAAELALLGAAEDHHRQGGRLRAPAQATEEVERGRPPLEVEVQEHHGRVDLERLDLGVAHRLRCVHGDVSVRRRHRPHAGDEAGVGRDQQDHRRRGDRAGGCALVP